MENEELAEGGVNKAVKEAADNLKKKFPEECRSKANRLLDIIVKEAEKWDSGQRNELVQNIKANYKSVEGWVCATMVNTVADDLESGKSHMRRGVLSLEGEELKKVFESAVDENIQMGEYSREWALANVRQPVYEGIAVVG